jgi:hypothetical protein
MKITTAWAKNSDGTYGLGCYDAWTHDALRGIPDEYREAIEIARDGGDEVRELVIEIRDSAVTALFKVPTVIGKAVAP